MKQPQWITVGAAAILAIAIFVFGRTVPDKKMIAQEAHSEGDGHQHDDAAGAPITIDSIMVVAKNQLNPEQVTRLTMLENSISRGDVKNQQLKVYHQLSHFWRDSIGFFQPYAWYEAESARLENSEKTLTFAARLFLENIQGEPNPSLRTWAALQAKDLLERSLKINPDNDSSKIGIGACYIFGGISAAPMEGISKITEVVGRDSVNAYALITLAKGSMISGQLDRAITRLLTVNRHHPDNVEAIIMLADVNERMKKKDVAIGWYKKSLEYISRPQARADIEERIKELSK